MEILDRDKICKMKAELGMVVHSCNPSSWEARQEGCEFVARLGCIVRLCLKAKMKKWNAGHFCLSSTWRGWSLSSSSWEQLFLDWTPLIISPPHKSRVSRNTTCSRPLSPSALTQRKLRWLGSASGEHSSWIRGWAWERPKIILNSLLCCQPGDAGQAA
jgi:hypothetical protein